MATMGGAPLFSVNSALQAVGTALGMLLLFCETMLDWTKGAVGVTLKRSPVAGVAGRRSVSRLMVVTRLLIFFMVTSSLRANT